MNELVSIHSFGFSKQAIITPEEFYIYIYIYIYVCLSTYPHTHTHLLFCLAFPVQLGPQEMLARSTRPAPNNFRGQAKSTKRDPHTICLNI